MLTYPRWSVGVALPEPARSDFSGSATVRSSDMRRRAPRSGRRARCSFPRAVGVGGAWRPAPRWTVALDLTWDDWTEAILDTPQTGRVNLFDGLPPDRTSTRDTLSLNAGAERLFAGDGFVVPLRFGVAWEPQGARDPYTRDPVNFVMLALGTGYNTNSLKFDAAFQYRWTSFQDRGRLRRRAQSSLCCRPPSASARNKQWRLKLSLILRVTDTDKLQARAAARSSASECAAMQAARFPRRSRCRRTSRLPPRPHAGDERGVRAVPRERTAPPEPPWWRDPGFCAARSAGRRRQLVRGRGLRRVALRAHGRALAPADARRSGSTPRAAASSDAADRLGRRAARRARCPRGRSRGRGPRAAAAERIRPLRHGHDRPRVVPRLVRRRSEHAAREPRRLVAAPRALVAALRLAAACRRGSATPTTASACCASREASARSAARARSASAP